MEAVLAVALRLGHSDSTSPCQEHGVLATLTAGLASPESMGLTLLGNLCHSCIQLLLPRSLTLHISGQHSPSVKYSLESAVKVRVQR